MAIFKSTAICAFVAAGLGVAVAPPSSCISDECHEAFKGDNLYEASSLLQVKSQPKLGQPDRARETLVVAQSGAFLIEQLESASTTAVCLPVVLMTLVLALIGVAKPASELRERLSKYVAEFVGTFVLVFTVCCCINAGSATWNATAIASVLMVMIYATGYISGGNLNPAVSFALAMTGNLAWPEMLKYWVAQALGGLSASGLAAALFGTVTTLQPAAPFTGVHAFVAELLYTFMLCFVVLNCAASKKNNNPTDSNQFFALAIGFVIIAGGYGVGGVSGACFNPAVALGVDIKNFGLGYGPLYFSAELIGATIAAVLYKVVRPEEGTDAPGTESSTTSKLLSEFLGTFILVVTVGLNVVNNSPATAFSAAAALMCMIYALGNVSGAHFNPAVTVACVARGKCALSDGVMYIVTQIAAGLAAGALAAGFHAAGPNSAVAYALQPGAGFSAGNLAVAELFFTFVLAYVVLSVATTNVPESQKTSQNFYFGLAIASCVTAGGLAVGAISGGELNPAVSVGVSMLSTLSPGAPATPDPSAAPIEAPPSCLFAACAAELLGGLLAAAVFRLTHPKEFSPNAPENFSKVICEFLGTFVLVFTVGCAVLTGTGTWNATSIACALMVMIYAVGPVSGANLNPAVSFALGLTGAIEWVQVAKYWAAQLAGGATAGLAFHALVGKATSLAPVAPFVTSHALVVEAIYTWMLCFVVLNCAVSKRNNPTSDGNQFFGLAIAFVIVAGGYAAGGISGACFNPAVAVGVDIKQLSSGSSAAWAVAELVGAAAAAATYALVRPDEKMSEEERASYKPSLLSRAVSEFLGVFMLVLTVGLNVVQGSPATAWSAAAALMCMIYALGNVSGAHFNPAVTLAVAGSERNLCTAEDAAAYTGVQVAAAVVAGLLTKAFHAAGPNAAKDFPLLPGANYTLLQAGFCEFFFTFVLAYVVLAVATTKAPASLKTAQNFQFALAIGSCVTAGGFAVGAVSGGELNPAVGVGLAAQAGAIGALPSLAAWELGGGLLAAVTFRLTHPAEYAPAKL